MGSAAFYVSIPHLTEWINVGCFQFWAGMDKAAVSIGGQVFGWALIVVAVGC